MVDNGSRKGTWVNGEPVETAGLIDGDVITFVPPDYKGPAAPKVKLRIPKGSVPDPRRCRRPAGRVAARPAAVRDRPGRPAVRRAASRAPCACPTSIRACSRSAAAGSSPARRRLAGQALLLHDTEPRRRCSRRRSRWARTVTLTGSRFSSDPGRQQGLVRPLAVVAVERDGEHAPGEGPEPAGLGTGGRLRRDLDRPLAVPVARGARAAARHVGRAAGRAAGGRGGAARERLRRGAEASGWAGRPRPS